MRKIRSANSRGASAFVAALIAISTSTTAVQAQHPAGRPIRLAVVVAPGIYHSGDIAPITIQSRDAAGKAAPVSADLSVEISLKAPSGRLEHAQVRIAKGHSAATVKLVMPEAGITKVTAATKHLIGGENVVNVFAGKAAGKPEPEPPPPPPPPPKPEAQFRARAYRDEVQAESALSMGALRSAGIKIALRLTPDRELLATGHDPVTVHAFLTGAAPTVDRDVKVYLSASGDEQPTPNPIVIRAGENEGTATFASTHQGLVKVTPITAQPAAQFELPASGTLTADFGPPITGIRIVPSPPSISLADTAELEVELVDPNDKTVSTDASRTVTFALSQGGGEIDPLSVSIKRGFAGAVATFHPEKPGIVKVLASTPELTTEQTQLDVTWPMALLAISIVGALAGGLVAAVASRRPDWWRVLIGGVTGLALYAFVVSTGAGVATVSISASNPITAFFISVVGGFTGTGVFHWIQKFLGFGDAATA